MIEIREFNDTITTNVPNYTTIKGHIIEPHGIVSFRRARERSIYAYHLFDFDAEIKDGAVEAKRMKTTIVNPDGFEYNGEKYVIVEEAST